jgi:hypothetical protein
MLNLAAKRQRKLRKARRKALIQSGNIQSQLNGPPDSL